MIKPSQIREKEFAKSTMGGYKTSDVDNFLDEVAVSYEQLYKENSELLKKLRLLVDNIEDYRKREQNGEFTADDALFEARAQADKIIADAKQEAERIIAEAGNCAAQMTDSKQSVDEIRKLREKEETALAAIKAESEKFRKSLLSMYTEHLTLIQSMVDVAPVAEKADSKEEKTYETKLDINNMEVDEKLALDDIDAFFADAVSDEQSRIREAFGGFRFEMGVEPSEEIQLELDDETVSDFEESVYTDEQDDIHSEIFVEFPREESSIEQETSDDSDETDNDETDDDETDDGEIKPSFKISFPEDEETGDNEEENLDDLFEGFFNSTDKLE